MKLPEKSRLMNAAELDAFVEHHVDRILGLTGRETAIEEFIAALFAAGFEITRRPA